KRHLVPLRELDLIVECLGTQPGGARTERRQFGTVIAEGARLRRTAARAGDVVPAGEQVPSGPTRTRVDVEDLEVAEVDRATRGREHQIGNRAPGQMVGGTVVDRYRQALGKHVRVVHDHATPQTRWATSAKTCAIFTRPSISRFSPSTGSGRPLDVP